MILSLSTFKKQPVLPVISIFIAILLISGQIFNCCGLNESISDTLTQAVRSLELIPGHKAQAASEVEPASHPNCHGHGDENASASTIDPIQRGEPGQKQFAAEDACLSKLAFTVNGKPSSPLTLSDFPVQDNIGFVDEFVQLPTQFEKPRPQNKSSPPIYLLTLHILV